MKDNTIYDDDSIQSLDFPPPHEKVYVKRNGKNTRYYEQGWIVGNYGVIFIQEIEPAQNNGHPRRQAIFECPLCHKLFTSRIDLVDGDRVKSCGCRKHFTSAENAYRMGKQNTWSSIDITGQTFGSLTALYPTDKRDSEGGVYWKCQCNCGGIYDVTVHDLKSGHVRYCPQCAHRRKAMSHIGERYGKLIILDIIPDKEKRTKNGGYYCIAQCDCGETITIPLTMILRKNGQQSCGQCSVSKGENKIKELLQTHGVVFTQQETFNGKLKMKASARSCAVDFYLPNQKIVIEYNGQQHYRPVNYFGGVENFNKQKTRDRWKASYCKEHHLKLIVIPYLDYDILDWNYLLDKGITNE